MPKPAGRKSVLSRRVLTRTAVVAAASITTALLAFAIVTSVLSLEAVQKRLALGVEQAAGRVGVSASVRGPIAWCPPLSVRFAAIEARPANAHSVLIVRDLTVAPDLAALAAGELWPELQAGSVTLRVDAIDDETDNPPGDAASTNVASAASTPSATAATPPAGAKEAGRAPATRELRFSADSVAVVVAAVLLPSRLQPADGSTPLGIELRGAELRAHREVGGGVAAVATAELPGGGTASAALHAGGGAPLSLRASALGVTRDDLRALPAAITDAVRGAIDLRLALAGGTSPQLDAQIMVHDLVVTEPRLAPEPVGPVSLAAELHARLDAGRSQVLIDGGELRLPPTAAPLCRLRGSVNWSEEGELALQADADTLDLDALVAALPEALRPGQAAPSPAGKLAFKLDLRGPTRRPLEWEVNSKLDLKQVTGGAGAGALAAPFAYHPSDEPAHAIWVGAPNPDFVPLAELPAHVVYAVTTSEDAGFFYHQGFDLDEVKKSVIAVAEAGFAVRGGSTISQQLAKNLYLSREKTYARKAKEALVTLALEAAVPKSRLLEIYLNIIEWGPGVHGIGQAARLYFGKDARLLTPREAVFLASIIPNPQRYYGYYARGAITDLWANHLDTLLLKMSANGVLDSDACSEALGAPLLFATPASML